MQCGIKNKKGMKNSILVAALAAVTGLAACTGGASGDSASLSRPGFDSLFTQAQADSLAQSLAFVEGMSQNQQFAQVMEEDSTLSKDDFVRGVRYGFAADTAKSFRYGLYSALALANQLQKWDSEGLKINHAAFAKIFIEGFMADSINPEAFALYRGNLNELNVKYQQALRDYELMRLEKSEASLANIRAGREFIDSVAGADPAVKVLASGVAVKVENPGEGPRITASDRVSLAYTASTAAGMVFDRATPDSARPVSVASRVNGLQEALKMLGAGGEATVYVPGPEAYGVEKNRRYSLGPNQMVIYRVKVLAIEE